VSQTGKGAGRNDPCPCGSGRKYKQCCLEKDEAALRKTRAKAAEKAAEAGPGDKPDAGKDEAHGAARETRPVPHQPPPRSDQPWKRNPAGAHPTQRKSLPRKVGK
jgi:hypothetical protein